MNPTAENPAELVLAKQRQAALLRRKLDAVKRDGLPFYRSAPEARTIPQKHGVAPWSIYRKSFW